MSYMSVPVKSSRQPILILRKEAGRTKGKDAQRNNITAAKLISEVVKGSLGPRGMHKILVDQHGFVTVTNDGATILKNIQEIIQHPAAKMLVEISRATESAVGDGTTSVVVLAGALLEKAEKLLDKGVHATVITDGYKKAASKALDSLEKMAIKIDPNDKDWLRRVAKTSLETKIVSREAEALAAIVADAITIVAEEVNGRLKVDIDYVKIDKRYGGAISDTKIINGIIVDKQIANEAMPKRIVGAKIALINQALYVKKTEFESKLNISKPEQIKSFRDAENKMLESMLDKIESVGANVVISQKGIHDFAQQRFAKAGIMAIRDMQARDMRDVARATGGRIMNTVDDLSERDLGSAALIEERRVFGSESVQEKWVFIEGLKNPKSINIFVRGASQRIVDEVERSIHDALMVMKDIIEKPAILAGGGAPEAEAAYQVSKWAEKISGRGQLAGQRFAEALESIPITLAENAGLLPIDMQADLRAKHSEGGVWFGVDTTEGRIRDMYLKGVFEPLVVKQQIIKSATEVACLILRIDDVIAWGGAKSKQMPTKEEMKKEEERKGKEFPAYPRA